MEAEVIRSTSVCAAGQALGSRDLQTCELGPQAYLTPVQDMGRGHNCVAVSITIYCRSTLAAAAALELHMQFA